MEKIKAGLKSFPTIRGWVEVLIYYVIFSTIAYLVSPNLINTFATPELSEILKISLVALVVPSLLEELFFRGVLIHRFTFNWFFLSLILFVLWHPFQVWVYLPQAEAIFTDYRFLFLVTLLGGLCTLIYYRTHSLWASVFLHWMVVVTWKALGGTRFVS